MGRAKRIIAFLMVFFAVVAANTFTVSARNFVFIDFNTSATVIEIVDVNAIIVRLPNGDEALVRMIGIADGGSDRAIEFLAAEIMGSIVFLAGDPLIQRSGRWNYMYVSRHGRSINSLLLVSGYARVNENHRNANQFASFVNSQTAALAAGLGIWTYGTLNIPLPPAIVRTNINTATSAQMAQNLDISSTLASNIANHRNNSTFRHINDLAFIPGMTREIFIRNRDNITVMTNISLASLHELMTLPGINQARANAIITYRNTNRITNLNQLVTDDVLTQAQLNAILPFVSLYNMDLNHLARPNYIVNVNTASREQLLRAGANTTQATDIINQRNAMPINSLHDLQDLPSFSAGHIANLSDNFNMFTNINTATRFELQSLFGDAAVLGEVDAIIANRPFSNINQISQHVASWRFHAITPYIYVGPRTTNFVNINTASVSQLMQAGFTETQARTLVANTAPLRRPHDIARFNLGENVRLVTIFTNINTASFAELESLDPAMSHAIVSRIVYERSQAPFGNTGDISRLFAAMDELALFRRIEQFVVVR